MKSSWELNFVYTENTVNHGSEELMSTGGGTWS